MPVLNVINTTDPDFKQQWRGLRGKLSLEGELLGNTDRLARVREIVAKVRQGRDTAVAELTAAYDKVRLQPGQFRITEEQLGRAHEQLDGQLLTALRQSIENVRRYQEKIKVQSLADWTEKGVRLGLRYRPVQRVGVCIPGASAPLVSTVIMTVVPAQVAGVEEIAIISSPSYEGTIHPVVLGLCYELKVTDVYRVSGAQGVAALAFGTEHIRKVDKIVGPSNWWGQLAKKEVYGLVDMDSFAGPSEVLIIADETANPEWITADMLSQAEHAPGSAILITDSQSLASAVVSQMDIQLEALARMEETRDYVNQYSLAVVTRDLDEAVELANEFAAEHLQVQCKQCDMIAERIINAGAIFIGDYTPVATGDYFAGPSHTLPTGGSARFFSALNVNNFLKQSSIISYDEQGLRQAGESITRIADIEGLGAHAKSVTIRINKGGMLTRSDSEA
ncbi:MAG: histidinol dehydrogenase [Sedimentisphaerales bacterium]|nr:histidinol dehydrogenase [Sedimentisphaerales bacterium]